MRILHIVTDLKTGGAEITLLKLLGAMDRAVFEQQVISLGGVGSIGVQIEALGVNVYALNLNQPRYFLSAIFRLLHLVRGFRPDIIQGWMYHGNLVACIAGVLCNCKIVLWNVRQTLAGLREEKWLTAWCIRIGAWLSQRPVGILYNSRVASVQHAAVGYCAQKTILISNGFDVKLFCPDKTAMVDVRKELGLIESATLVGLVARYHPMKDHDVFLVAASYLATRFHQVHFVLVGREVTLENSILASRLTELKLTDRVHLLGERVDTPRITAALTVAVSCSWRGEAFSNAVGEAMASGVPCVVTDVGDSALIVGEGGRVIAPKNPRALADSIAEILDLNEEEYQKLSELARRRIESQFSLERVAAEYGNLYLACQKQGVV
ncbi:RfaG Glycosyltransferase [Burkholderiaceae bacterium]